MKNLFTSMLIILVSACSSEKPDTAAAMKTAEQAMLLISDKNFDELSKLYASDFAESEPREIRDKKFSQIVDATGQIVYYQLKDSLFDNNIVLKYEVKHDRISTLETYTLVQENGKYLIAGINISNE